MRCRKAANDRRDLLEITLHFSLRSGLLGLLRELLQTQASAWQEAEHRNSGDGTSDGSNHLAAVDAVPGLYERC
jgi:hypothetical protein